MGIKVLIALVVLGSQIPINGICAEVPLEELLGSNILSGGNMETWNGGLPSG